MLVGSLMIELLCTSWVFRFWACSLYPRSLLFLAKQPEEKAYKIMIIITIIIILRTPQNWSPKR